MVGVKVERGPEESGMDSRKARQDRKDREGTAEGAFCGTPLGFNHMLDRLPSVRCATLGFGVQRRWRIKNKIGASGAY